MDNRVSSHIPSHVPSFAPAAQSGTQGRLAGLSVRQDTAGAPRIPASGLAHIKSLANRAWEAVKSAVGYPRCDFAQRKAHQQLGTAMQTLVGELAKGMHREGKVIESAMAEIQSAGKTIQLRGDSQKAIAEAARNAFAAVSPEQAQAMLDVGQSTDLHAAARFDAVRLLMSGSDMLKVKAGREQSTDFTTEFKAELKHTQERIASRAPDYCAEKDGVSQKSYNDMVRDGTYVIAGAECGKGERIAALKSLCNERQLVAVACLAEQRGFTAAQAGQGDRQFLLGDGSKVVFNGDNQRARSEFDVSRLDDGSIVVRGKNSRPVDGVIVTSGSSLRDDFAVQSIRETTQSCQFEARIDPDGQLHAISSSAHVGPVELLKTTDS